jgi:LacI family transcriptional regulator
VVVTYATSDDGTSTSVTIDDEDGGFQIVNHLISKGHQKIGVIAGLEDSPHTQGRLKGYQRALFESQILFNPQLVIEGDWKPGGGYECTDHLLQQEVTAIFCMNDLMVVGAYKRLNELNLKIGEDISVVGFDNRDIVEFLEPALTTIKLPLHDIGYQSGETMLQLLQNSKNIPKDGVYAVKCYLISGESVKDLNQ